MPISSIFELRSTESLDFSCPQDVKEAAYKGMVRAVLEYGGSVWDLYVLGLQDEEEKVKTRVATLVS